MDSRGCASTAALAGQRGWARAAALTARRRRRRADAVLAAGKETVFS